MSTSWLVAWGDQLFSWSHQTQAAPSCRTPAATPWNNHNRIFLLLSPLTHTSVTNLCCSAEAPLPQPLCLCLGFQGGLRFDTYYKRTSFDLMLPKSQQCCCHSCVAFSFVGVCPPPASPGAHLCLACFPVWFIPFVLLSSCLTFSVCQHNKCLPLPNTLVFQTWFLMYNFFNTFFK